MYFVYAYACERIEKFFTFKLDINIVWFAFILFISSENKCAETESTKIIMEHNKENINNTDVRVPINKNLNYGLYYIVGITANRI